MKIPEVAHKHPQRVYVVRTSFWAGHSDWEDAPVAARSQDGRTLWNTLENDKSFLKPNWGQHTDHHKELASSSTQLPRNNPATQLYYTQLYTHYSSLKNHHPVSVPSQAVPQAIRSRDSCQDIESTPTPLSWSNHRDSPPGGRRMKKTINNF